MGYGGGMDAPPVLVLRPRLHRKWVHTWVRLLGVVAIAGLAILAVVNATMLGVTWLTFVMVGMVILLIGCQILTAVFTSLSMVVTDGMLQARIPLRTTRTLPLASVRRVVQVPLKPAGVTSTLYRSIFVLIAEDGSVVTLLAERNYRPDQLTALLAVLPTAEREASPRTMREIWKAFKLSAPLSVRDLVLTGGAYVLAFVGLALILVGLATRRGGAP